MLNKPVGKELHCLNHLIARRASKNEFMQYAKSVTGTNGWIIGFIADNSDRDIYQKDLEEQFTITRSTASKVIKLMEQKGFITRCSVPHDARLKKLTLTPSAVSLHESIKKHFEQLENDLVKGFTQEEIDLFLSFVERMKENVS